MRAISSTWRPSSRPRRASKRACTSQSSWTATAAGPSAGSAALRGPSRGRARGADASSKPRRARHRRAHALRFFRRQLDAPAREVASLMRLLQRYLVSETRRCLENGVRLSVIGRRDRLSADLVRTIEQTRAVDGRRQRAAAAASRSTTPRASRSCSAAVAPARAASCSQREFERCLADAINSDVHATRRPPDPHRRRTAAQRFPALGMRVRGARVRRPLLAGLRRGRVRLRAARVREPRSPFRRPLAPSPAEPLTRPLTSASPAHSDAAASRASTCTAATSRSISSADDSRPCAETGLPPRLVGLHLGRKSNRMRRTGDPKTNTFLSKNYYVRIA